MPSSKDKPDKPQSAADAIEKETIAELIAKHRAGKKLGRGDVARIRQYERERREEQLDAHLMALPRVTLARLLDTNERMINKWLDVGMPRNTDKGRTYNWFNVLPWIKARWLGKNIDEDGPPQTKKGADADERYRLAKAKLAEHQLAEKEGQIVQVELLRRQWESGIDVVRRAGENLGRRFGPEAQDMFNEALEEGARVAQEAIGTDDDDGGTDSA